MAEKLDEKELVSFEELLRANTIQVDTVTQLLIEKGVFSEQDFFTKLKQAQNDYESKRASKGSNRAHKNLN
jgi:beta-N-acetylglucosaminidase